MAKKKTKSLKITQVRSVIDQKSDVKKTMIALGLKKIRQTVTHGDTPQIRGMVFKVKHLVTVEEVD